jgi:hypothetical protein
MFFYNCTSRNALTWIVEIFLLTFFRWLQQSFRYIIKSDVITLENFLFLASNCKDSPFRYDRNASVLISPLFSSSRFIRCNTTSRAEVVSLNNFGINSNVTNLKQKKDKRPDSTSWLVGSGNQHNNRSKNTHIGFDGCWYMSTGLLELPTFMKSSVL